MPTLQKEEATSLWQLHEAPITRSVRERYPLDFSFSRVGDGFVEIAFSAEAPSGIDAVLDESLIPVTIVENFGTSEFEMIVAGREIHDAAVRFAGEGVAVASGPHPDSKAYRVEFAPERGKEFSSQDLAHRVEGFTTWSRAYFDDTDALRGFTIEITESEVGAIGDANWGQAGGTPVNARDSGLSCTSGFVVSARSGDDIGVVTAGHCSDNLRQISPNGNFNLDFRGQHIGVNGDMQWMRSPVMMDAWFHYDHGLGRPQQARSDVSVNRVLYLYGRTGGRQMATVIALNQSHTVNGQTSHGLVRVNGSNVQPGDSGGPVYYANTALGIIKGYSAFDDFYTPINAVLNQLNVDLCIDPPGCL